jgi:hypothetical protein
MKTRSIVLLGIFFLLFLFWSFSSIFGIYNINKTFDSIIFRLFAAQPLSPFIVYKLFPESIPFLNGASYALPSMLFGTRYLIDYVIGQEIFGGVLTAPTGILAGAYANFGFLYSIVEFIFFWIVVINLLNTLLRKKSARSIGFAIWFFFTPLLRVFSASSVTLIFLDPGFLIVGFFYLFATIIENSLRRQTIYNK